MKAPALVAATVAALLATSAIPAFAASETYDREAFTKARIDTSIKAKIVVGPSQSISAEAADPATFEDLRIEVVNGKLHAWMEDDFWDFVTFRDRDVTLTITVPVLDAIAATSSADIAVSGATGALEVAASSSATIALTGVQLDKPRFDASSSADIDVDGSCTSATVSVSSSATISGDRFECVDLKVTASSSADARLFASGQVDAEVSSSANLVLLGDPDHVDDDVSSSGNVDVL
jgi:hypothetical protein